MMEKYIRYVSTSKAALKKQQLRIGLWGYAMQEEEIWSIFVFKTKKSEI